MASEEPLYLGFDLSTQQLKCIAISSDLRVHHEAKFDFDQDSHGFQTQNGVLTNAAEHEVYAPVCLWLQALDGILDTLKRQGLNFAYIGGISGAGQQHGSVFWSVQGVKALGHLDPAKGIEAQLKDAFAYPYSPNWQDTSTQIECEEFDEALGDPEALAKVTGSSAHHRFTGPQILRFQKNNPMAYENTARISLVSSFLASILLGKIAPIDISDACGLNLWDIPKNRWHEDLLKLASRSAIDGLLSKLGEVAEDGGDSFGTIARYFVDRYGFSSSCRIIPFTGDNPATILAVPLRPLDAIVSLGTSTTFLMSTPEYNPDPKVHFMNHPTTPGLYMFMLCYKNGGLAREKLRDAINRDGSQSWNKFNKSLMSTPRLGIRHPVDTMKLGLFFPLPEIVPPLPSGTYKYTYDATKKELEKAEGDWWTQNTIRATVEGQMLSLRLRSQSLVRAPDPNPNGIPPQPRRIYLVGGGSQNAAIAHVASEVLGGAEGIYRLDVGQNACALGAAYKAVWGCERKDGESFENLIGKRWREEDFAVRVEDGYRRGRWEHYGLALDGFEKMEQELLAEHRKR